MSDTPSPDIPDPASPTPVNPGAGKPRRVITRPDTMVTPRRQPGTVVTRPDAAGGSRLPGTYAANYGSDPNWKRGAFVICTLFVLAAVAEFLRSLAIVWSGSRGLPLPPDTSWLVENGRIVAGAVIFLLLWIGWSWVRWLLVVIGFFFGMFFLATVVAPLPTAPGAIPALSGGGIVTMPQLALGVIYLVSAAYFAFSADVISFARHRREEGRGWVVAPLALGVGACVFALCGVKPFCQGLFQRWKPEAARVATDGLRAMAQSWDVAAFEQRADPEYLKVWTADQRKGTFGTLAGLGSAATTVPDAKIVDEPKATVTRNGGSFRVDYLYDFGKMRFAHGSANFGGVVSRSIGGKWQLQNLLISEPEFDPAPTPVAAPTPTPDVPPAP